jgi:glycosyltransferase involved in cell wall biosynthesis
MKVLWLTWKDRTHPLAGGAEVVNEELAKRLIADGHEVIFIVGGYKGGASEESNAHGFKIVRLGSRISVYWKAYRYYKEHLIGWADLVIDEVNTMPFFAKFYVKEPHVMLIYMLCRNIWFYQLPQPLSTIGYILEPVYMRLIKNQKVITESLSTKYDLQKVGFNGDNIHIISVGLENPGPTELPSTSEKADILTILSLGSIRPMKQTLHQIKAFEFAKREIPQLKLNVAGDSSGKYGQKVLKAINQSKYAQDITYCGRVSADKKMKLMRESHCIVVTSVKEGWGLIVTEANSQGTPAVVYGVDGLRDSVQNNKTGLVTEHNSPECLAANIVALLKNTRKYRHMREIAWEWSKAITFDNSYKDFIKVLNIR